MVTPSLSATTSHCLSPDGARHVHTQAVLCNTALYSTVDEDEKINVPIMKEIVATASSDHVQISHGICMVLYIQYCARTATLATIG